MKKSVASATNENNTLIHTQPPKRLINLLYHSFGGLSKTKGGKYNGFKKNL